MKNLLTLTLASALFAMHCSAGTLAMTPAGITDSISSYTDTEGWAFSSSQSFQITALDYYDPGANSLTTSHQVGIWTATGTLLLSATIPSGAPTTTNGVYESVAITPYSLGPGSYVIGATVGGGPDLTILATTSEPTIAGIAFNDGGFVSYSAGLSFPTPIGNNARPEFLTANLEVEPVSSTSPSTTPEPASWGLLALGTASLCLRSRFRTFARNSTLTGADEADQVLR